MFSLAERKGQVKGFGRPENRVSGSSCRRGDRKLELLGYHVQKKLRLPGSCVMVKIFEALEEKLQEDYPRCVWHGLHHFRYNLFQDGIKGSAQEPYREGTRSNPLFHLKQVNLEKLMATDKPVVRKLVETIQRNFDKLLEVLPAEKYPKTRTYVTNFPGARMTFLQYWLDHHEWPPFTTNVAESGFSRIVNRIKWVGRRWSNTGLSNWLMPAVRKIFDPAEWMNLWRQYFQLHCRLRLQILQLDYR